MARYRTVKPEFFTSEQVVECSTTARLLFVGLWCFCDDGGVHPASVRTLKMEVFPGDPFTIQQVADWIGELSEAGLIETYHVDGKDFWRVTGWHHQKIERPLYRYPRSQEFGEVSTRCRRGVVDSSPPERNGTERNGVEKNRSGPVRENRSDRSEDFDERLEVISGNPVLSEALAVAVEPLEPGKLAGGAFKAMETRHLAPAFVREWFRRQLAIDEPVLPGTRADLILAISAGLYAAQMPDSSVRRSRVAAFVNVVSRSKWKSVGRYVHAAIEALEALEATERQEVGGVA